MDYLSLAFPCDYGNYRLTGYLGSGATAEVYRAEARAEDGTVSEVAIRLIARGIDPDFDAQKSLLEEARLWVSLRHPNIVRVLDIGQFESDWFLVLELVDGCTLDQLLRGTGPLPVEESLLVAHRMALALSAAHTLTVYGREMGVVHRDLNPSNILLSGSGAVKLTDFGIARTRDRLGRTGAGVVRGTLHFLAPEQVRKEVLDARTDLFALGCTLHNMLTGRPLLDLPKDDLLRCLHGGRIPAPPAELPGKIRGLLATLTAADPAGRPPTALDAAEQIGQALLPASAEEIEPKLGSRVERWLKDSAARDPEAV